MLVKCKICGKEFEVEPNKRGGRVSQFCSDECRRKARSKINTKSLIKRYHADEEWRKKRIASNVAGNRRRREERRELAMQQLVFELGQAKDAGEMREILEEKVRIKSQYYA